MDLKSYRAEQGWTLEEAAGFAGFANESVWRRYETGERHPSPRNMATIERLTGGKVTASDMLATRRAWEKKRDADAATRRPGTVPA